MDIQIWNGIRPLNLRHAMELAKDYAREEHNLSVERIAERMGQADHWTLYKWFQNGRMPITLVPAFEVACGIDYVTRWLAASSGRLLIAIPTGRHASAQDMHALQEVLHLASGQLLQFYSGKAKADAALTAIQLAMEGLAWHRGNIEKHMQPELEFEEVHQ